MTRKFNSLFTPTNVRLFDLLFRHQVYLEGFKEGLSAQYKQMLTELYGTFAVYLTRSRYDTMDQFTRGELKDFVHRFQLAQAKFYNAYTDRLIGLLKQFLSVDVKMTRSIFEDATGKLPADTAKNFKPVLTPKQFANLSNAVQLEYVLKGDQYVLIPEAVLQQKAEAIYGVNAVSGTQKGDAELWSRISTEPIPASGEFIKSTIDAFTNGAMVAVLALIRQGYANGWTTNETLQAIAGSVSNNFRDGLFARLQAQDQAMVNTLVQHVSSGIQAGIASVFYERYMWVSIMDTKTTLICRSRNGNIYIYGKGPLPPAHYYCRSKGVPFAPGEEEHPIPETYVEWLQEQPEDFQNDVLGGTLASQLRSGQVKKSDFASISTRKPLTLSQFEAKIRFILGE